jgi:hypothetical protein
MSPSDVLLRAIDFFRACGVETRATDGLDPKEVVAEIYGHRGSPWTPNARHPIGCTFRRFPFAETPEPGIVWFPLQCREALANCDQLDPELYMPPEVVYLHEAVHALVGANEALCTVVERAIALHLQWPEPLLDKLYDYGMDSCLERERADWRQTLDGLGWIDASGCLRNIPAYRSEHDRS